MRLLKIILIVLFIITLLVIGVMTSKTVENTLYSFNQYSDPVVTNLSINLSNTDLNIIGVENDVVTITSNTSKYESKRNDILTYVDGDTLYVENTHNSAVDRLAFQNEINIYVPSTYEVQDITVEMQRGNFTIDGLNFDEVNTSNSVSSVSIENSKFKKAIIEDSEGDFVVKNSTANSLEFTTQVGSFNIQNSTVNDAVVSNIAHGQLILDNATISSLQTNGQQDVYITLNPTGNYDIKTDKLIDNPNFRKSEFGYTYIGTVSDNYTSVYDLGNNEIKKVDFNKKKA